MHKLRFLLIHYARPFYRSLGVALALGAAATAGAAATPHLEPVAMAFGALAALLGAASVTLGVVVLNVFMAARLGRAFEQFEAAYDAHRRATGLQDPFYEEADLAEAAARELEGAQGA